MENPSEEQKVIIDLVCNGNNVIVDACAGSGKSTTILSCAMSSEKRILQLTYNKTLRHEVQEKVAKLNIKNLDVHTYHSLAYNFYHHEGQMDNGIRRILREDLPPLKELPNYDILVVDEAQDMTKIYYMLLLKYIRDSKIVLQIMIMGDKMQGLYEFKGADTRFLTLSQYCWEKHPQLLQHEFTQCKLQTSYRITVPMSRFVNNALLGEKRLWAIKKGTPVVYVRRDSFSNARMVVGQISNLLKNGSDYDDFYILAGSIKGSFIKVIENMLVERDIPCYLSTMENNDQLDKRITHKKVVFSTFHSVKGKQRKHVFVVGFNESYFTYYARNLPMDICPNTLYVGCTRATDKLFVFENSGRDTDQPLPFLQMSHALMMKPEIDYIQFQGASVGLKVVQQKTSTKKQKARFNINITDLIKFLSEEVLDKISPVVDKIFLKIDTQTMLPFDDQELERRFEDIEICSVKETHSGHFEDVSDINGIVLPILFYDYLKEGDQQYILQSLVKLSMIDIAEDKHKFLHCMVTTMPKKCNNISDYLFLANLCNSVQEKLYSKLKQINIDEYDWLDEYTVETCIERLDQVVGKECKDEKWHAEKSILTQSSEIDHYYIDRFVEKLLPNENFVYRIGARVDLMTESSIWEMKCTSNLTIDHKLQLILYMWTWNMLFHPSRWETHKKKGCLFNIKSGELLELQSSMEDMNYIVSEILKDKYKVIEPKTDEEFIEMVREEKERFSYS